MGLVDTFGTPCKMNFWVLKDPMEIFLEKKYIIDLKMLEVFNNELTKINALSFLKREIVIYSGQERLHYWNVETGKSQRRKGM